MLGLFGSGGTTGDVTNNFYGISQYASIAVLKGASAPANGTKVVVGGYYADGDGGGGVFYYDASSSTADDGGCIIAPTAGSGRWKRIYSGAVNVKWFGAKGDGVTDDTAALAAAIAPSSTRRAMFLPMGKYRITSALNLTNRFGPYTIMGEGQTLDGIGSIIYAETSGGVAIDCTGSSHTEITNLSIVAYGRPNPSAVGILHARSTTAGYNYSQFNKISKVLIRMPSDISLNGGKGSVAIYNKAAESNHYTDVYLQADNPLVFTGTNTYFNIASPYATINDAITSCSLLTIDGSSSALFARNETTACALLSGAYGVTFNNTYFQGTGFAGANNRAIVALNSHKVHVNNGNIEELNSVAYLENCDDIVLNVSCTAHAYAPIEIGAGKYVNGLVFKPYVVVGPYTNWPRFINAGTGATHNFTHIEVPGDNGTVPGSNCTDIRGYLRIIKGASPGTGGFFNMHLPGNPVMEQACIWTAVAAGGCPNNSMFLDSADGIMKFKDSSGVVHALW